MFFSRNLKLLRTRRQRSQADLADLLDIKRSSLSGYEIGASFPNFETLIRISDFFKISIDKLLRIDLGRISELQLSELEKGYDIDLDGKGLRVLATTVDKFNEENIELVNIAAKAGYTRGYADPDFIKVLPTFQLPFLDKSRKYRTFQISGDSMPPVNQGAYVTAEYLPNWHLIKDGFPHIIITKDDGIVFKNVFNQLDKNKSLKLYSTNSAYEPYEIDITEVVEIWKFVNYINNEPPQNSIDKSTLNQAVQRLEDDMNTVKNILRQ